MVESKPLRTSPSGLFLTFLQWVTIIAVLAFLVREVVDADTWWQVAIGRDILARGAVPSVDIFASAAWGRTYHDSHWLFQVVAAIADRFGGMHGVCILMILIWCGTLAASYRAIRKWIGAEAACVLLFFAALACSDRFTPRPDTVTALMIALFTLRLQRGKYKRHSEVALLAVLQVIWTNSHGLFVIGPFMAACYWTGHAVERLRGKGADLKRATLLLLTVTVASFISPFGWEGWRYALLLAKEAGPTAPVFFATIAELAPTFGSVARSAPDLWAFYTLLVLLPVSLFVARREPISLPRLLITAGLLAAACTGRRNVPLFVLVAAPFIAENLRSLPSLGRLPRRVSVAAAVVMLAIAALPLSGRYYLMLKYPVRFGVGPSRTLFSEQFPVFFRSIGFRGQIYNSNYLGGYCMYYGIPPLTDGRWEVYNPQALTQVLTAPADREAWEQVVSKYDVRGVLLLHTSSEADGLIPQLRNDPRWRLVYVDRSLSFWMRTDVVTIPQAVDPMRIESGFPPASRPEDEVMVGSFLAAVGAPGRAVEHFRMALSLGGGQTVLSSLGRALTDAGRYTEAEEIYNKLLEIKGRDAGVLNELAFFAFQRGDRKQAESYLRESLAINPTDPAVLANYRRIRMPLPISQGGEVR